MSDPSSQPTQPLTEREWERLGELVAGGHFDNEYRAVKGLYEAVVRERAEAARLRAENTAQAAALAEVARLHQPYPDGGMGYRSEPYPDSDGAYGQIDPCCQVCGTPDEYAAPYPCGTARALGLDQDGRGQANA